MSEFMGSTGADFPSWAQDASFESLQAQETMLRQDGVAEWITGWPETAFITDPDTGIRYAVPARRLGSGGNAELWNLTIGSNNQVGIANPGHIRELSKVNDSVTITDLASTFTAEVGKYLYIELTGSAGAYTATLKMDQWDNWPEVWKFENPDASNGTIEATAHYLPLYEFVAPDSGKTGTSVSKDIIGYKLISECHLQIFGILKEDSTTGYVANAPILTPTAYGHV